MSAARRSRGGLFPRALGDVVRQATKPLMDKQGKLYGALLRDWAVIVGPERAQNTRPQKLQWPNAKDASGAILHLEVAASVAPELTYESEQILEQCARYFGYRAIARMIIHPSHAFAAKVEKTPVKVVDKAAATPLNMAEILSRLRVRIAGDDKSSENR